MNKITIIKELKKTGFKNFKFSETCQYVYHEYFNFKIQIEEDFSTKLWFDEQLLFEGIYNLKTIQEKMMKQMMNIPFELFEEKMGDILIKSIVEDEK